jgi:NAD(P)-dependent dehydrogenase (short-subunit alcohol dehydrogenase family)
MKTVLVTGSSDGIGKATAAELATRGCAVIVHGRNEARAQQAAEEVHRLAEGGQVTWVAGDFASLAAVRAMADRLLASYARLDVLVNNAAIISKQRGVSSDGYESTFAINHLAPFLLTNLLRDRLDASAPARIVNVSSGAHTSGRIDFDNLQMEHGFDSLAAYCNSKLANGLFTLELARRLVRDRVTANFLHPGVISTKLLHVLHAGGSPIATGITTSVFLALDPSVAEQTGGYYVDEQRTEPSAEARDADVAAQLWRVSAELVGLE